jgi:hypothetical protein
MENPGSKILASVFAVALLADAGGALAQSMPPPSDKKGELQ